MNEMTIAAKFLMVVAGVILALSAVQPMGRLTYKMAEVALHAYEHDQMSYGRFSHKLWDHTKKL